MDIGKESTIWMAQICDGVGSLLGSTGPSRLDNYERQKHNFNWQLPSRKDTIIFEKLWMKIESGRITKTLFADIHSGISKKVLERSL